MAVLCVRSLLFRVGVVRLVAAVVASLVVRALGCSFLSVWCVRSSPFRVGSAFGRRFFVAVLCVRSPLFRVGVGAFGCRSFVSVLFGRCFFVSVRSVVALSLRCCAFGCSFLSVWCVRLLYRGGVVRSVAALSVGWKTKN